MGVNRITEFKRSRVFCYSIIFSGDSHRFKIQTANRKVNRHGKVHIISADIALKHQALRSCIVTARHDSSFCLFRVYCSSGYCCFFCVCICSQHDHCRISEVFRRILSPFGIVHPVGFWDRFIAGKTYKSGHKAVIDITVGFFLRDRRNAEIDKLILSLLD